jgi:hypothetical protein
VVIPGQNSGGNGATLRYGTAVVVSTTVLILVHYGGGGGGAVWAQGNRGNGGLGWRGGEVVILTA